MLFNCQTSLNLIYTTNQVSFVIHWKSILCDLNVKPMLVSTFPLFETGRTLLKLKV